MSVSATVGHFVSSYHPFNCIKNRQIGNLDYLTLNWMIKPTYTYLVWHINMSKTLE
jgi:hypothetical protein